MHSKNLAHILLSVLIFIIVDRLIKFAGTYQRDSYKEKNDRLRVELSLTAISTIFIIITLKMNGKKLFI
jgi:hypothetical protein